MSRTFGSELAGREAPQWLLAICGTFGIKIHDFGSRWRSIRRFFLFYFGRPGARGNPAYSLKKLTLKVSLSDCRHFAEGLDGWSILSMADEKAARSGSVGFD